MFMKEPRTFYDSVKPIIHLNFILGMGAYRQPNISDTAYFCMQIYTIIVNLLKWTSTYIGLTGITSNSNGDSDSIIADFLFMILLPINSTMTVISPFLIWLQIKRLKDCLRQLQNFDDTFRDILGALNDYKKQYISLIYHLIVVVLAIALLGISDALWISMEEGTLWTRITTLLSADYPAIVILVLDLNFCICVSYLQKKFRDLNDSLLRMAKKSSGSYGSKEVSVVSRQVLEVRPGLRMNDTKAENSFNEKLHLLHEIRKMYLELCRMSRKTNVAFGIQNLLSMGTSFAMTTSLLYAAYDSFSWQSSQMYHFVVLMSTAAWINIYVSKIWIVNHSCWNLKTEFTPSLENPQLTYLFTADTFCNNIEVTILVSISSFQTERTGHVIYELLETRIDREFQKEIKEFAVQIIQNPVRFDACGFFTLDHTFVQGVIGSITTYLVILIQMGNAK